MSSTTLADGGARRSLKWPVTDALAMTRRNLLRYRRVPRLLVFATMQPVMLVLLFAYVFGGAISVPGVEYIDYLMPGIFAQALLLGATQTGVGLAEDLSTGMIDRLRSLPMARSAVLAGRTLSDMARNTFVLTLMLGVGYLIGFRFHGGAWAAVVMVALGVLFGFAFSWFSAFLGLMIGDAEATQTASMMWMFPLVFASSAFVPVASMPEWLQAWAEVNPVSVTVDTMRALALDSPVGDDLWKALAWTVGIVAVFAPLAVHRYRHRS